MEKDRKAQESENRVRREREKNIIRRGVRDYRKVESAFNITSYFLRGKLKWRG